MKVAFCFYGLVGSKSKKYGVGDMLDPTEVFKYYKNNVFSQVENYDIFLHSQSYDLKEKLVELYKPKDFLIEKQKYFFFQAILNIFFIKFFLFLPIKFVMNFFLKKKYSLNIKKKLLRSKHNCSRWYSTKKSVDLMNKYQIKNNIKYDFVLLTRFDVAFLTPFKFDNIDPSKITVPNHNDVPSPRNNYSAKIVKNNRTFEKGISDFWFLGEPNKIIKFSKLYDRIHKYLISSHMSSFQHIKYLDFDLEFFRYRGIDHEAIRRLKQSEE